MLLEKHRILGGLEAVVREVYRSLEILFAVGSKENAQYIRGTFQKYAEISLR